MVAMTERRTAWLKWDPSVFCIALQSKGTTNVYVFPVRTAPKIQLENLPERMLNNLIGLALQ